MPAHHGRDITALRRATRIAGALMIAAACGHALGERGIAIGTITGRDFAGIDLPESVQQRAITLAATRAWAWAEGATNRVALDGDVRVSIGEQNFRAVRAVVWMEPITVVLPTGEEIAADQLAISFDGVTAPGAAPTDPAAQRAEHLLVTGVVHGPAPVLKTDFMRRERPRDSDEAFVADAEARFAAFLTRMIAGPNATGPLDPEELLAAVAAREGDTRGPIGPAAPPVILPPEGGTIAFSAGRIEIAPESGEDRSVELTSGLAVQYIPPDRKRTIVLQAERGVVFMRKGATATIGVMDSKGVSGIYLEGDASVTDGQYSLRGSRMYYNPATERAVVLDAVFSAWDARRGMPLYMRATAVRQSARGEWVAEKATLANVAMAEPQFSIGVNELTIRQQQAESSGDPTPPPTVEATGVKFEAGTVPLLGLPRFAGEVRPSPLKDVRYSSRGGDHLVATRWDLFTILNREAPPGSRLDLLADAYITRGPAVGLDAAWSREDMTGDSLSYYIYDNGEDRLSSGARIDHEDDSRGMFTVGNIWRVSDLWTLSIEGSYISDPTFVDAFFDSLGETRREFTNSFFVKRQTDQDVFSLEARGTFNDFIANEYLLQSQGYVVERLPEARYSRFSDQFLDFISYSTENSAGWYDARFSQPSAKDYGYNTKRRASAAFGTSPSESLADVLQAQDFPEGGVGRFDTRHEVEAPLALGAMNIVPFAVGRGTWWSRDFDGYDGTSGVEDEGRIWGATGVRTSTSIVHVDNGMESEVFDLHRIRHIIEPYSTLWVAGTNVDPENLPIYDDNVEGVVDGTIMNTGVRQTWQTERGPERARRSVDWLVLDASYTWSSDDTPRSEGFQRFIMFQPELSNPGEFVSASGSLLLTEAVTIVGEGVYDLDDGSAGISRGSAGISIDHGDSFRTFLEYRYLRDFDDTSMVVGAEYELNAKYAVAAEGTWNLHENRFQNTGLRITRRFIQWTLDVGIGFDDTSDIFEASVSLRPVGFSGETRRRPYTYDEDFDVIAAPVTPESGRYDRGPFRDPQSP